MDNRLGNINGYLWDKETPKPQASKASEPYFGVKNIEYQDEFEGAQRQPAGGNVAFKGLLNSNPLTFIMEKMENGGFLLEFLALDFFGMMIPRTYQAFTRNQEDLGHLNYKAGSEELIRELLTGPSMMFVPMIFMASSRKCFGASTQINEATHKQFKEVMEAGLEPENLASTEQKAKEKADKIVSRIDSSKLTPDKLEEIKAKCFKRELKKQFIGDILDKTFEPHNLKDPKATKAAKDRILKQLLQLEKTSAKEDNKSIIRKFIPKLTKEEKDAIGKIEQEVKNLNKKCNISLDQHDLLNIGKAIVEVPVNAANPATEITEAIKNAGFKYADGNIPKTAAQFSKDVANFTRDVIGSFAEKAAKGTKENYKGLLNDIVNFKIGIRRLSNYTAVGVVGAILLLIPVIYKRNKQFPGIEGLVNNNDPKQKSLQPNQVNSPNQTASALSLLNKKKEVV